MNIKLLVIGFVAFFSMGIASASTGNMGDLTAYGEAGMPRMLRWQNARLLTLTIFLFLLSAMWVVG